jgi:hypothetical protein
MPNETTTAEDLANRAYFSSQARFASLLIKTTPLNKLAKTERPTIKL